MNNSHFLKLYVMIYVYIVFYYCMTEKVNASWVRTIEEFESELNSLVDSDKTPWIDSILEVTYSKYPKFKNLLWSEYIFNRDVFEKFSWYPFQTQLRNTKVLTHANDLISEKEFIVDQNIDFDLLGELFASKMSKVKNDFASLLNELESSDYYEDNPNKKEILKQAIEYNLKLLALSEEGFVFEMEKAWYKHGLSDIEVEEKIARLETLETDIFWGKIIDNQQESKLCFEFMKSKLNAYKWMDNEEKIKRINAETATRILSDQEIKRLEWYYEKINKTLLSKGYDTSVKDNISKEEVWVAVSEINPTCDFLEEYWEKMISREVYVDMFQKCLDLLWLPQKVRVTWVTWIYDWPEFLDIPDNEKYSELPLKRVMKLISHEIMWHYVNQQVHEESFWKVRGAGNVEKEEWLAKFLDTVVLWGDVNGMNAIVPNMSRILAWEILSPDEFEDFVDLYGEITEKKAENNMGTILRHKRNYPIWYKWVQHKDVTYSRGLIKVVNFLKEWWSIHELFQWKFSIDDIREWITWNSDFNLNTKENPFNPVLITDIMLFFMIAKTSEKYSFTQDWFTQYVQEKYWDYLSDSDISWEKINKISRKELVQVFWIVSPVLQSIEWITFEVTSKVANVLDNSEKKHVA